MQKIVLKILGITLSYAFLFPCLGIEDADFLMKEADISEDEKTKNVIRHGQRLQGDTIWEYSLQSTTEGLNQHIVFELKSGIFHFKGYQEIGKQSERYHYFGKLINNGRPIKVINTEGLNALYVQTLFCDAWSEAASSADYYKRLQEKARATLHQHGYVPTSQTYTEQAKEEHFLKGLQLIEARKYQAALDEFKKSEKQQNVIALYEIGLLYVEDNILNSDPNLESEYLKEAAVERYPAAQFQLGRLYEKHNFDLGFSWIYLAALQQYVPALEFTYEYQEAFLPFNNEFKI